MESYSTPSAAKGRSVWRLMEDFKMERRANEGPHGHAEAASSLLCTSCAKHETKTLESFQKIQFAPQSWLPGSPSQTLMTSRIRRATGPQKKAANPVWGGRDGSPSPGAAVAAQTRCRRRLCVACLWHDAWRPSGECPALLSSPLGGRDRGSRSERFRMGKEGVLGVLRAAFAPLCVYEGDERD